MKKIPIKSRSRQQLITKLNQSQETLELAKEILEEEDELLEASYLIQKEAVKRQSKNSLESPSSSFCRSPSLSSMQKKNIRSSFSQSIEPWTGLSSPKASYQVKFRNSRKKAKKPFFYPKKSFKTIGDGKGRQRSKLILRRAPSTRGMPGKSSKCSKSQKEIKNTKFGDLGYAETKGKGSAMMDALGAEVYAKLLRQDQADEESPNRNFQVQNFLSRQDDQNVIEEGSPTSINSNLVREMSCKKFLRKKITRKIYRKKKVENHHKANKRIVVMTTSSGRGQGGQNVAGSGAGSSGMSKRVFNFKILRPGSARLAASSNGFNLFARGVDKSKMSSIIEKFRKNEFKREFQKTKKIKYFSSRKGRMGKGGLGESQDRPRKGKDYRSKYHNKPYFRSILKSTRGRKLAKKSVKSSSTCSVISCRDLEFVDGSKMTIMGSQKTCKNMLEKYRKRALKSKKVSQEQPNQGSRNELSSRNADFQSKSQPKIFKNFQEEGLKKRVEHATKKEHLEQYASRKAQKPKNRDFEVRSEKVVKSIIGQKKGYSRGGRFRSIYSDIRGELELIEAKLKNSKNAISSNVGNLKDLAGRDSKERSFILDKAKKTVKDRLRSPSSRNPGPLIRKTKSSDFEANMTTQLI